MNSWIRSQQVGQLAYILQVIHEAAPQFDQVLARLQRYVLGDPRRSDMSRRAFLRSLAPSDLSMLAQAARRIEPEDSDLGEMPDEIASALCWLTSSPTKDQEGASRLNRVQIWSSHALAGYVSPAWLARLGEKFFAPWSWAGGEGFVKSGLSARLSAPLEILRDPWTNSNERCQAIADLLDIIPPEPAWVRFQIQNYLHHQQFFWPLLVCSGAAISLPVAVDVYFDDYEGDDPLHLISGEGPISVGRWRRQLRRCIHVGKELWRSQHGNHGEFRTLIMSNRTKVTFDFRYAQEVVAPLFGCGLGGTIEIERGKNALVTLSDRSADAYFAQAVLNRLLGQTHMHASAATGMIGPRVQDPETKKPLLNFSLLLPAGLLEKLSYAFSSRGFERIILPRGAENTFHAFLQTANMQEIESTVEQSCEVLFVGDLKTMADTMQVRGWRKYQYVRCPEIAWSLHGRHRERMRFTRTSDAIEELNEEVRKVLDIIQDPSSTDTVRTIDADVRAVADALWHINMVEREHLPGPPPALSWTFIRVREYEQDANFWHLLWDLVGASAESFRRLLQTNGWEAAVEHVAEALNAFSPRADRPSHRAPDLLILMGSDLFNVSFAKSLNPHARELAVPPILRLLAAPGRLEGPFDSRLVPLVGNTRIICIPYDINDVKVTSLSHLTSDEIHILHDLAIFEGGFSQNMACLILESSVHYHGNSLRNEVLIPLVKKGALRYGQGKYHLVPAVREALLLREERSAGLQSKALRRYRAGCSMAPYAASGDFPALAIDTAFDPQYIHESKYHFQQALRLAQMAKDESLVHLCRNVLMQHSLLMSLPTWGSVADLLKSRNLQYYAYELASDLVRWKQDGGGAFHPSHWLLVARATAARAKQFADGNTDVYEELVDRAEGFFRKALDACSVIPQEAAYSELVVLSYFAEFLSEIAPNRASEIVDALCDKLDEHKVTGLDATLEGLSGRVFEFAGDREGNAAKALRYYVLGYGVAPAWAQLWIKAIGTGELANRIDVADSIRSSITEPSEVVQKLSKSRQAYLRQKRKPTHSVLERWETGFKSVRKAWGNHREVRIALEGLTGRNQ